MSNKLYDGQKVMYKSETGSILGPFTVVLGGDDGTPGLWYLNRDPAGPGDWGDHVHGIVGDEIITVGWETRYGRTPLAIDESRIIPEVLFFGHK